MRKFNLFFFIMVIFLFSSCKQEEAKNENTVTSEKIGAKDMTLTSDIMTPEVLWSMGRIGEYDISPDNSKIVYNVTYYSVEKNKGNSTLYIMNADGSNNKVLSNAQCSEYSPQWRPDGKSIGFMCSESGSMQLWEIDPDGKNRRQISNIENGITGFKYAPDQSQITYIKEVKLKDQVADIYPDLPLSSGRVNNDLMYRHWDQWVDTYGHVFLTTYDGKQLGNSIDLMEGEQWESPLRPFGGMEQIQWTTNSGDIIYCSRKKTGKEYALSTNSDIYKYNIVSGECVNLTDGMMGYDLNPVLSPDGKYMAWESMERDGYESDKQRLYVLDLTTGEKKIILPTLTDHAPT
jgi:WD40-like Beta Propeller Repeat.